MQLTSKLIQLLPLQIGAGKNGQWKKQDIIVETEGQFPKNVCISIWGEKLPRPPVSLALQQPRPLTLAILNFPFNQLQFQYGLYNRFQF